MKRISRTIRSNIYLSYTIVFLVFIIIGLLPLEIKNEKFLFSGLFMDRLNGIDGLKQHLLFMYDFVSKIKDSLFNGGELGLFRYDIGLGSDFLVSYSYYSLFDPLTIVAYLIPIKYIEFSYYLLIFIRLYLAGIFIILLAKKLNIKSRNALLATSIFYVFNMAVLFSAFRHPMFINGSMLLPLVILGAEHVIEHNGRPKVSLLIIASFLALITQFYFFVYTSFGFIIYLIVRLFPEIKKMKFMNFIKLVGLYLIGALLAGFVLVPQLIAVLNGARAGGTSFGFYNSLDYATYLLSLFLPVAGGKYTASIGNLVVFFICLLFIIKDKRKSWLSNYLLILIILGVFAAFGYILSGFSYVNNRWTFIMILPAALIVGKFIEDENLIEVKETRLAINIIISLFVLSIFLVAGFFVKELLYNDILKILVQAFFGVIGLILAYRSLKKSYRLDLFTYKLNNMDLYKGVIFNSIISLLLMSGVYCFLLSPGYIFNSYYESPDLYSIINDDPDFFRVEQKSYVAGVNSFSNDGIYYGFSSTSSYNTMVNGNIIDFIEEYNINNANNTVGYNGFDFRTRLLQYGNVKYLIVRDSDKVKIPNGYSLIDKVLVKKYDENKKLYEKGGNLSISNGEISYENANIYKNDNPLNFGVVYDSYLTKEEVKNYSAVSKELFLLDTVIVENDIPGLEKYQPDLDDRVSYGMINISLIPNEDYETKGFYIAKGKEFEFEIENIVDSEVYFGLRDIEASVKRFSVTYETDDMSTEVVNYAHASNMYVENSEHVINLGYYENKDKLKITVRFNDDFYSQPLPTFWIVKNTDLNASVSKLNENSLSDLSFNGNGFTGKLNSSINGILNIPIPYSSGFKAYVNGDEVEVLKVNTGFMGIYVDQASVDIEFVYRTPGLDYGLYLSLLSMIAIVVLTRSYLISKIELKEKNNKELSIFG